MAKVLLLFISNELYDIEGGMEADDPAVTVGASQRSSGCPAGVIPRRF